MTVERHENATVTSEDPPHNVFFNGYVNSKPGSSVAVSNKNGLVSWKKAFCEIGFKQLYSIYISFHPRYPMN